LGRYLITTADENTWPIDKPVLFLGVWCKRYNREHVWSQLDSKTAKPYLDREADRTLSILFDQLLTELVEALNEFHKVSYSRRYWNIIVGPWLRQYLKVIINRFKSLDIALSQHNVSNTLVYKSKENSLIVKDIAEFCRAINNDVWNSSLYSELLSDFNRSNLKIDILDIKAEKVSFLKNYKTTRKRKLLLYLAKLFNKIHRASDAFIVKSYLPAIDEIRLQVGLWQIPQLWVTPNLNYTGVDALTRATFGLDCENYSGLDRVSRKFISKLLPTCYLENYKNIYNQVANFSWPSRPKFIFTSNSFAYDEGFKFWAAQKAEDGVPYYIGQHGSNYGTVHYSCNWTELTTCDKFLSWGWTDAYDSVDIVPAFNFKTARVRELCHNEMGSLLLMERGPGLHDGPKDRQFIHSIYQKDMLHFFDYLPDYVRRHVTVRLHHGSNDLGSSDKNLWEAHSDSVSIDLGTRPLNHLLSESRVVVITYDSSAILEMLAFDIPVVCFWRDGFSHLLSDALPYYELLSNVGIIHDTPESAARHIATHWDKMELWWNKNEVRMARNKFCSKYSKIVENPIATLKKILIHE